MAQGSRDRVMSGQGTSHDPGRDGSMTHPDPTVYISKLVAIVRSSTLNFSIEYFAPTQVTQDNHRAYTVYSTEPPVGLYQSATVSRDIAGRYS